MDSRSPPSSSGLFKRASSLAVSDVPESGPSAVEIESGDAAPLLRQGSDAAGSNSSSTTGAAAAAATIDNCDVLSQEEQFRMIGHVALSFLFLMLGSSIVPLFAAAEKEAWRSQNIPYQQTRAGDVILDFELNYPLVLPATITTSMLIATAIGGPLLIVLYANLVFIIGCKRRFMGRKQMHELRASLCALFVSVGLSETVTCTLKLYVSRHRPNFYALCGFDPAQLKCMAPSLSRVHEATLSFPSGHSSLSFCGMSFLMYFFLGRVSRITPSTTAVSLPSGRTISLRSYKSFLMFLSCIVPWSYATFVATSRIVDKWHHPSDVIAGSLLGIACATIGYHSFFAPTGGVPLSLQTMNPGNEENNYY